MRLPVALIAALAFLAACQPPDRQDAPTAAETAQQVEWPGYGRDPGEQRHSPLVQINTNNVDRLGLAWYHEFDTDRGQQATPLMVDGVLYTSSYMSKVYAFNPRTGRLLWSYDPEVPTNILHRGCCDANNRGVAVDDGRVFIATFDGRLIALDAENGQPIWSVMTVDPEKPYTSTGEVRVFDGKVFIGNGGAEFGVRGYVSAYDAKTGDLAWRFYTVPNPDGKPDGAASDKALAELADDSWFGKEWKVTGGGGTVWDSIVYDPEARLVYVGVGNGSPHNHQVRSDGRGDNLFLSSILALRVDSGEYVWHYQVNPGDSWDFTATQPLMLAELPIKGQPRKVIMQAPKNGFFYVLDRLTGELLSANNFIDVNWASGIDLETGRPIEHPDARYTTGTWVQMPGSMGAHAWHPMAYSPENRLVYIPAQISGQPYTRHPDYKFAKGLMNTGQDLRSMSLPDDPAEIAAARAATRGRLIAWDPVTQTQRWAVEHPSYLNGGVLATAGGLVFQGTAGGELVAYDAANGARLWSYTTVNGIVAPPISYATGGEQYIAVMVGYGGAGAMLGTFVPDRPRLPGRLMVFKLGAVAAVTPYEITEPLPLELEGVSSPGDPVKGMAKYNTTCLACHGINARSGYTADLRRSSILRDANAWKTVVLDGAFADKGMASFADHLSPEDAEDIRAFVLGEARKLPSP